METLDYGMTIEEAIERMDEMGKRIELSVALGNTLAALFLDGEEAYAL